MEPTDYLKTIRRRWRLVAIVVAGAMVGGWLSGTLGILTGGKAKYPATVSMVQRNTKYGGDDKAAVRSGASGPTGAMSTLLISSLVTNDVLVSRVAKKIAYPGRPETLAKNVSTSLEKATGVLKITAQAAQPERSKLLANTFAAELIAYLIERDQQILTGTVRGLEAQIARVRAEVAALDKQIKKYPPSVLSYTGGGRSGSSSPAAGGPLTSPADPLVAQRQSALQTLSSLSTELQQTKVQTPDGEGLEVIQAASLDESNTVLALPRSQSARVMLAAILGLLAGIGLALVKERLDPRIRTKEALERHLGYPVLAEIPDVRKRGQSGISLNPSQLAPQVADAFRLLGSGLNGTRRAPGERQPRPRVILVTSAAPGAGKAAVLVNLAGTLSEVGKTVTVVSCDFRHPDVPIAFGVPNERGLAETLLAANGGPLLTSCIRPTSASGVFVVPSGTATEWTSDQLLASGNLRRLLMEARQRSDLVLVDSSPILTSDPAFLLPEVDGVLVVVQAGTTKPELAERSSELLKQMGARVLGAVLIGNETAGLPRGYYRPTTPRHVILGAPRSILRGARRAFQVVSFGLKFVARGLKSLGRPFKAARVPGALRAEKAAAEKPAVETAVRATPTPATASLATPKPPVETAVKAAGSDGSPNGDRGFPRLMRRSDTR